MQLIIFIRNYQQIILLIYREINLLNVDETSNCKSISYLILDQVSDLLLMTTPGLNLRCNLTVHTEVTEAGENLAIRADDNKLSNLRRFNSPRPPSHCRQSRTDAWPPGAAGTRPGGCTSSSAWKNSIRRFVITEKRPLLGPSPGWKQLLPLSHLRPY